MDEFLSAAKALDEQAWPRINRYDLGVALLLEYFSLPILRLTKYARLKDRPLIGPAAARMVELVEVAPPYIVDRLKRMTDTDDLKKYYPEFAEALTLVGHALDRRRQVAAMANQVSRTVAILVAVIYAAIPVAIMHDLLDGRMIASGVIVGGSFLALTFAAVVCRANLHWRPPAGL